MALCQAVSSGSRLTPCGARLKCAAGTRMGKFRSCNSSIPDRLLSFCVLGLQCRISQRPWWEVARGWFCDRMIANTSLLFAAVCSESLYFFGPCNDSRPSCAQKPSETLATPFGTRVSPTTVSRMRTCSARPSGASRAKRAHTPRVPSILHGGSWTGLCD